MQRQILPQLRARWEREDFDLFLSHNSRDKPDVIKIDQYLQQRGILGWLDSTELRHGTSWIKGLGRGLRESPALVAVLGAEMGQWQEQEIEAYLPHAVKANKPLVPIRLPGFSEDRFDTDDSLQFLRGRHGPILERMDDLSPLDSLVDHCCRDHRQLSPGEPGEDSISGLLHILARAQLPGVVIRRLARTASGANHWFPPTSGLLGTLLDLRTLPDANGNPPLLLFVALALSYLGDNDLRNDAGRWLQSEVIRVGLDPSRVHEKASELERIRSTLETESQPRLQIQVDARLDEENGTGEMTGYIIRSHLRFGASAGDIPEELARGEVADETGVYSIFVDLLKDVFQLMRTNRLDAPRFPLVQLFVPVELLDEAFEWCHYNSRDYVAGVWPLVVASLDRHKDYGESAWSAEQRFREILVAKSGVSIDCVEELPADAAEFGRFLRKRNAHALRTSGWQLQQSSEELRISFFEELARSHLPVIIWLRESGLTDQPVLRAELGDDVLKWPDIVQSFRIGRCSEHRPGIAPSELMWRQAVLFWDDHKRPFLPTPFTGFCFA